MSDIAEIKQILEAALLVAGEPVAPAQLARLFEPGLDGELVRKVLDELRRKLALDYLSGKKVSVNETAYLVGFSEPAAFSRAFKRWTGTSPRAMRNARSEAAHPGPS